MNLESIGLSERNQSQKNQTLYDFISNKHLEYANPWREKVDWWLPGTRSGGIWGEVEKDRKIGTGLLWGMMEAF